MKTKLTYKGSHVLKEIDLEDFKCSCGRELTHYHNLETGKFEAYIDPKTGEKLGD